jgi:DNA-directed RNA polymerase subunit RPC12/RpoP
MGKKACKKNNFEDKGDPEYECRKCGAKVKKDEMVCKPKKL